MNLNDKVKSLEIREFEDIETAKTMLKECNELEKRIENTRTQITGPVNEALKKINNMAKEIALPVNEAKLTLKKKILDWNEEQERIKKAEEERIQNIVSTIKSHNNGLFLADYTDTLSEEDKNNFIVKTAIFDTKMKIEEAKRAKEEEIKRAEEQAKLAEEKKKMSEEQAKLVEEKMKLEQEKRELEEQKRKDAEAKELAEKEKIVEQIKNTEVDKVKWMRTKTNWEIVDENCVPRQLCTPDSKKINEMIKSWITEIPWLRIRQEKAIQ